MSAVLTLFILLVTGTTVTSAQTNSTEVECTIARLTTNQTLTFAASIIGWYLFKFFVYYFN
jgi:hypothetical protein